MIVCDFYEIGNKMLHYRKGAGLTQAEFAEKAQISDRTYADIERGTVNMRIETFVRICNALHVTPNDLLLSDDSSLEIDQDDLIAQLNKCTRKDKQTALHILNAFLASVNH